ncbi:hypothetical protein K1719_022863 [Acacia pycnantha]|nr:hypothetical protein K1719_022863 [Acacia pycnantha]
MSSSPNASRGHDPSETNLSSRSDEISRDTIPSSSKASASSSSSNTTVSKVKLRRKEIDHDQINNHQEPSSPYYKGLLYQPISINTEYNSQNYHHQSGGLNNCNSRVPTTTVTSSEPSPYYKGLLTNSSLGIHGGGQDHLQAQHDYDLRIHEVEGAYEHECSPYFRGLLTDSSLAMAIWKLDGGGGGGGWWGPGSPMPISFSSFTFNNLCSGGNDENSNDDIITVPIDMERKRTLPLSPPAPIPLPAPSLPLPPPLPPPPLSMFLSKGMSTALSMELKVEEDGKPLGGRESEETTEEKAVDIENNKELKAMNESGLLNEEVIKKKKSLREIVSNNISEQTESANNKGVPNQEIEEEEEGSLKEYVWADKYQPKALQEFICHKHIVSQLLTMIKEGCVCEHFIFEGPPGVGKRTMIRALLREVFGHDEVKVIEEYRTFVLKGEVIGSIQVPIIKSAHHVEVNLSQTKGYKEQVVADLLKETYDKIINISMPCEPKNCHAIIIYEAEKLSSQSLLYIKWMLERYNNGCNKVFFCCADESKLQIVKPICKTFRLAPPPTQEIVEVLKYIGKEEGKDLSSEFLTKVVEKSKNNLRQTIRSLEATCLNKDSIKDDELILTGWEDDISNIAKTILKEQSSKQLYTIHVKLQSLMIHKVSPDFVYKYLISELKSLVDESLKPGLEKLKKVHNQNGIKMRRGKHSGHGHNKERESDETNNETPKTKGCSYSEVEEFIAKFMNWYKSSAAKSDNCN